MFFWTQFAQKRGHYGPRPRWKKFFLAEIKKADNQLSESFYFIKISYVLTELWIFFYLEWCFLSKKCHFQRKQLCYEPQWCHGCCVKRFSFMLVRFQVHIHSLFILVDIIYVSNVLLPPTCFSFGLPVPPACLPARLSVKLQWMIQVTKEIQGNSWIQEFWVCCK